MIALEKMRGRFRYAARLYALTNNRMSLRTLRGAVRYVLFLVRLSGDPRGQVSVIRFFLRFLAAHLLASGSDQDDTTIRLRGTEYSLGLRSLEIFSFGEIYQERVYDREARFIPGPGWTVLDLGANVGLFAVRQARRGARVYAFEPNPDCYRRLSRTVAANGLDDAVRVFDLALGRTTGTGTLRVPNGWSTVGTVLPVLPAAEGSPAAGSVADGDGDGDGDGGGPAGVGDGPAVRVSALDDVVPTLGLTRIDLLKVDVEGAEVAVLQGAVRTLEMVDRIIVEYHAPDTFAGVNALLGRCGFAPVREVRTRNAEVGAGTLYFQRGDGA